MYNAELLKRTPRGAELLKELVAGMRRDPARAAPIEASQRVLEAVSATQHPQGIVAAFPFPEWPTPKPLNNISPLALVCDNIQDPGNLGTILRTAEAAGVTVVWLSPGCVDLYNPKVVRAAMGTHFRLPVLPAGWGEIRQGLQGLEIDPARVYATGSSAPVPYYYVDWRPGSSVIISNEAHGASREAMDLAGGALSIPMAGATESLNAATSAAIVLFEAVRQRRKEESGGR
jgi:TrmH family RNA methyltransferase